MLEIKPPEYNITSEPAGGKSLFLGGTIDNGLAENWQKSFVESMKDLDGVIYNPRRETWDPNLEHSTELGSPFREQVEWELYHQTIAGYRLYYFAPKSISVVSMLELGAFSKFPRTLVVCNKDYFRYGNVKIFCEKNNIHTFSHLESAISYFKLVFKESY